MEGPSVHALADRLQPLVGQTVEQVRGNARQPIDDLEGRTVVDVRAVKKRLVVDCGDVGAVLHFLMYGTYRVNERKDDEPRLALMLSEDAFNTYHCSAKVWPSKRVREELDPSGDVLRDAFDAEGAREALRDERLVVDVLLDQDVFGGVGNIIKNEALFRAGVHPERDASSLSPYERARLFDRAIGLTWRWYEHDDGGRSIMAVYRGGDCPVCGTGVQRAELGRFDRITFWCPACQPASGRPSRPPRPVDDRVRGLPGDAYVPWRY